MDNLNTPALPRLGRRPRESHKGDYGRLLLVGGSRGMTGAIALAGMSALRGGAGLVTLAVPDPCLDTVAGFEPSYLTAALPADHLGRLTGESREALAELLPPMTAVACGPGLGRSETVPELVSWLFRTLDQPAVFDADGLTALSRRLEALSQGGGPRILTPHEGELARLLGDENFPLPPGEGQGEGEVLRRSSARPHPGPLPEGEGGARARFVAELAERWGIVLVLKGHRTIVSDGTQLYVNTTGNPGMATGGTGDVLTGVITALLGQGLAPFAAAQLGVYVHGRAGDLAAAALGEASMTARDLVDYLPAAIREVSEPPAPPG